MQNRYVGDIGDYVKLAILRALMPKMHLGVAWWLYPDEGHNTDGRHITYLDKSYEWRSFDTDLFDNLKSIVRRGERQVSALEEAGLLPGAIFYNELLPTLGTAIQRRVAREQWFRRAERALEPCDLLFLDPDNGLETMNFDAGASKAGKSVSLKELKALRSEGRALIVYHHQTRMAGGHHFELNHWGERLRGVGFATVDALRSPSYSARAFFILDANPYIRSKAQELSYHWGDKLTWHPSL